MDMTYRVSKNAYIELLADMVRRNDSRPIKLLTTLLLTLGQRLSCPLHAVGPVEERADALYIYCGGTIFDIIPAEAFKNAEAMQRFARDLRAAAEQAEMPGERRTPFRLRRPTSTGRWTKSNFSTGSSSRSARCTTATALCGGRHEHSLRDLGVHRRGAHSGAPCGEQGGRNDYGLHYLGRGQLQARNRTVLGCCAEWHAAYDFRGGVAAHRACVRRDPPGRRHRLTQIYTFFTRERRI